MANHPSRKLQVYQAQIGFHDMIVAVPNRAAALRTWDTHQDLFANGEARIASDEAAIAAALKHPGQPLRRAVGSKDAFALEPASLPQILARPRKQDRSADESGKPPRPSADRTALVAAEEALREVDAERKREETHLRKEAEALDARRRAAQEAYAAAQKAANDLVIAARAAYKEAGGTD